MRFSLRTLLIALTIGPLFLALAWSVGGGLIVLGIYAYAILAFFACN